MENIEKKAKERMKKRHKEARDGFIKKLERTDEREELFVSATKYENR